jgi:cytochrome b subunit of formate dehydrogenase
MASLERYGRRARWFHAGVYVFTFVTLGTGLWIEFGKEGQASFLALLLDRPDIVVHEDAGWVLVALGIAVVLFGYRGVARFTVESLKYRSGDLAWLTGWPRAAFTGRFRRNEGHFDPGQRIANLVMSLGLLLLIASGTALVFIHGGSWFVRLSQVHRWSAMVLTPVIAGHVIVASGLLPGYRRVWRSMHWGGKIDRETAERLWPAWLENQADVDPSRPTGLGHDDHGAGLEPSPTKGLSRRS